MSESRVYLVMGRTGPLARNLTRPEADALAKVSGARVEADTPALAAEWRVRAAAWDGLARLARQEGDPEAAEDYEAAAADYRLEADRLEGLAENVTR